MLVTALAFHHGGRVPDLLSGDVGGVYFSMSGYEVRESGRRYLVIGRLLECSETEFDRMEVVLELTEDPGESGPMVISGFGNFWAPKPGEGGDFDERAWFRREGWFARIKPKSSLSIEYIEPNYLNRMKRSWLDALARSRLPPFQKRLARALLFGRGRDLSDGDRMPFSHTGTAHVLAVSGLHVGMVFALLNWIVSFIPTLRWRRALSLFVIVSGLLAYCWVTDFSPSVVRSSIMFSAWVISMNLERDRYSLNGLWLAALISLIIWPLWIFSAGFHLSYTAVAAILIGFDRWRLPDDWPVWKKRLGAMVQVTVFAQLGTLAVSWYYFGLFPLYFLPANMIFTPLIALLLYGSWLVLIGSSFFWGKWMAHIYGVSIELYRKGLLWLSHRPFSILEHEFTMADLALLAIGSWMIILRIRKAKGIILGLLSILVYRVCFWFG